MTKVLDHGYVTLVEAWGSDEHIIEAARMSTNKGFLGWGPSCPHTHANDHEHDLSPGPNEKTLKCSVCGTIEPKAGDEKLLGYLWEHKHATPFEMAGMVIEVQAPIFVFREWHRHRTQSYNEMSARYTPMPDLNYVPTIERLLMGGGHLTKQAGSIHGAEVLDGASAERFQIDLHIAYVTAESDYQSALKAGVPKELARLVIPVGRYSRMRASANLRNWLAFLTLRQDPAAQWEIRQYANAVADLIKASFPRTHGLFTTGQAAA